MKHKKAILQALLCLAVVFSLVVPASLAEASSVPSRVIAEHAPPATDDSSLAPPIFLRDERSRDHSALAPAHPDGVCVAGIGGTGYFESQTHTGTSVLTASVGEYSAGFGLADSPWPKFRQNTKNTGKSPYTGPEEPELKWAFPSDGSVISSPAIGADGAIYVGSYDNNLHSLNPDGTPKWSFAVDGVIWSSPAVADDGTIYVGTGHSNEPGNHLYAINPDGTLRWSFTAGDAVNSSPAVGNDGTIYVGSQDNKLYALNPDGTLKWSFATGKQIHGSSPAIGTDGTIYVGSYDNKLYAINPNGTAKWTFTAGGWFLDPRAFASSPAVGDDGTIYAGSWNGRFYALNPNGSLKWSFSAGGPVLSSAAIGDDGTIYVGCGRSGYSGNRLYALNPDGTLKWSFVTGGGIWSNPAIGADGTIYVGSEDNNLYALNPDGTEKWRITTDGWVGSSPTIGADGTVYVGSHDGSLYAIGESEPPPVPRFLTLPFNDSDMKIQQGWRYSAPIGPNPDDPYAHKGIDYIKGIINDPSAWQSFNVVAAADGVAMWSSGGGYGDFVLIRHDETDPEDRNYFTLYGHLGDIEDNVTHRADRFAADYQNWTPVTRGQKIGVAGATGVTDPTWLHLHFEVQRGAYAQNKVDPYDIYGTRDYYPGGPFYTGCGENALWMESVCPPPERPYTPTNVSPQALAQEISDSLTLVASPFDHPDPAADHAASRWQVFRSTADSSTLALDTGQTATHLEEYPVQEGVLEPYTWYAWRVSYRDDQGRWSAWSQATRFKTGPWWEAALFEHWPPSRPTLNLLAQPDDIVTAQVRVRNTGSSSWDSGYRLVFVEGDSLCIPQAVELDHTVGPLQRWDLEVDLEAPAEEGIFEGYWSMENPEGRRFGSLLRIRLNVSEIHPDVETAIHELRDATAQALDSVSDGAKQVADDSDFFGRQVELRERRSVLAIAWSIPSALVSVLPGVDQAAKLAWQVGWGSLGHFVTPGAGSGSSRVYMPAFQAIMDSEDWGNPLVLEAGLRFYPATYTGNAIDDVDVVEGWEEIMKDTGLVKRAHPLLVNHNKDLVQILQDEVRAIQISGLPHLKDLPLEKQIDYATDLQARRKAVDAMVEAYLYQSGVSDPADGDPVGLLARLRPEFEQEPGLLKKVLLSVAKIGTSVAAFAVGGPFASAGVAVAWAAVEAYSELQKRNAAEQLFVTGLGLMGEAVRVSITIQGNSLGGLGQLQLGHTPRVVAGDVGEVGHVYSYETVTHRPGYIVTNYRYYTTVTVENTGEEAATFMFVSQYVGDEDGAPHVIRDAVTLRPGQETTVELLYSEAEGRYIAPNHRRTSTGVKPLEGESVVVTVLGVNETGTFFVHQDIGVWDPTTVKISKGGSVSATGVHPLVDDLLLKDFPIEFIVYAVPNDLTYQGLIWVTNPLEDPLTYSIAQPLLPDITVLDAEDAEQEVAEGEGSITLVWEETLESGAVKPLAYRFDYAGDFVHKLELPPMEAEFFDAETAETLLDVLLEVPPIVVPLPVLATVSAPAVVLPTEAIESTVYLLHRLDEGYEASGLVEVSLLSREGQTIYSDVQGFQVPAAGAQNLTFSLTGLTDKGRYQLATNITYAETQRSVDIRSVRVGASAPRVTLQAEPVDMVFTGESLGYNVEVQNLTEHTLSDVLVRLETPSGTQIIVDSISKGGQLDPGDPQLVLWELPDGLDPGEEAAFSVQLQIQDDATEPERVSLLTAQAWIESREALPGRSAQATTFVAEAPESLVGAVTGQVVLEGREDHGGAKVQVGDYITSTDAYGHFFVEVPAGDYEVRVTRQGLLSSWEVGIYIAASETLDLEAIHLPAGEVTDELPPGVVWQYYEATLEANGGTEPYIWDIIAGHLPDGLNLDTETGVVSGTPTQAETFDFTIKVTDDQGLTTTQVLSIAVVEPLEIITAELPASIVGEYYEEILAASGGTQPYTWDWTAEEEDQQVPPGLYLAAATGVISGTPTEAGTFSFSVEVTDDEGLTASRLLAITVTEWDPWFYDENGDGIIQKMEALQAVQDYFAGKIAKTQVLQVIQLYFMG